MESLIEFILEATFQLFGEVIMEAVFRSKHPAIRVVALWFLMVLAGTVLGLVSLSFRAHHIITNPDLRLAALLTLPLLNGWFMTLVGRQVVRAGHQRSAIEYFLPGFFFSLAFGMMRFFGAAGT